ncbi:MAG: hypothetical protein AAGF84_01895 [Planctomycetota bacterium]
MSPTLVTFTGIDWAVLIGYMVLVSVLGVKLAGKQKDMQDFFRGGDKLPWYAVSASLIATTISAVTFVGVPAIAFNPNGGNMTYLQLGLIAGLISRVFITYILVPAYYEKRIYSPYDYMGDKLGGGAKEVTTGLFTLGGLLAQSARVYLTALVLTLVMKDQLAWVEAQMGLSPLATSIILIGIIAIAWTMLGGIATVVWTDALLFLVFVTGGVAALWVILSELPGGFAEFVEVGREAGKFTVFDFDKAFSLVEPYTLAAAGFAVVVGNIGAYGTDQLLAQRIFCCKDKKNAQWAMMSSYAAEAVAYVMLLVGVGLFVYYTAFPERLSGAFAARVAEENDKIFPAFILEQMPLGVTGLVIAGIFAAAISSLTSILAALAQTTISAVYLPARARKLGVNEATEEALAEHDPKEGKRIVNVSRAWIVFWGVALCLAAFVVDAFKDATGVPILDLALGLASYIVGGLFAAFLLAWLPFGVNGRGLVWAAPLGVLAVFASRFHDTWAAWACGVGVGLLLVTWLWRAALSDGSQANRRLAKTFWLLVGSAVVIVIQQFGTFEKRDKQGDVVRADVPAVDDSGEALRDLDPVVEPWRHVITDEPLLDEAGEIRQRGFVKRTPEGEALTDEKGKLKLQDVPAEEAVFFVPGGGEVIRVSIAWPWYAPIGGGFALLFGYLLADRRDPAASRVEAEPTQPEPALSAAADAGAEADA